MCGVLIILLGMISFGLSWKERKCTSVTQGTVVGLCKNPRAYNTGTSSILDALYHEPWKYHIVYTYEADGKCYNRASETAYTKAYIQKRMNTTVVVYFNPAHPEESSLSELTPDMKTGIKLVIIGCILTVLAVVLIFYMSRGR